MTKFLAILAIPLALTALWQRMTRESNSHAENVRGVKAYNARQYPQATASFARAFRAQPTPPNAFNLGTAQIAAGNNEEGAATLGKAMGDRALRQESLYNRGNGALASSAYDPAIRDYTEALRMRPGDMQAKRNLEIALARKEEQRKSQSGQNRNPSGSQPNQKPQQQQPSAGKNDRRGEQSADSILRAVQQQEQEELNRMKRAKAERGRIGW